MNLALPILLVFISVCNLSIVFLEQRERSKLEADFNPVPPLVWSNDRGVWFQRGVRQEGVWVNELWQVKDGVLRQYGVEYLRENKH